jgi:hypothetical protein
MPPQAHAVERVAASDAEVEQRWMQLENKLATAMENLGLVPEAASLGGGSNAAARCSSATDGYKSAAADTEAARAPAVTAFSAASGVASDPFPTTEEPQEASLSKLRDTFDSIRLSVRARPGRLSALSVP